MCDVQIDEEFPPPVVFDRTNPNWIPEYNNYNTNMLFLRGLSNHLNQRLIIKGHLFLNEVYDELCVDRTREGSITGWLHKYGSKPVSFDVTELDGAILIKLDVDGVIYDKI